MTWGRVAVTLPLRKCMIKRWARAKYATERNKIEDDSGIATGWLVCHPLGKACPIVLRSIGFTRMHRKYRETAEQQISGQIAWLPTSLVTLL